MTPEGTVETQKTDQEKAAELVENPFAPAVTQQPEGGCTSGDCGTFDIESTSGSETSRVP